MVESAAVVPKLFAANYMPLENALLSTNTNNEGRDYTFIDSLIYIHSFILMHLFIHSSTYIYSTLKYTQATKSSFFFGSN